MSMVRLQHPNLPGQIAEVPAESVGQHAMAGWVPVEGEAPPECPTCHQVWPAYAEQPPQAEQASSEAPAEESGASASKGSRRRRTSSEESE